MSDLFLIGCCREKQPTAAAARDLYVSERFRKCVQVADRLGAEWVVLSALHGVVASEQRLAPYDVELRGFTPDRSRAWIESAVAALRVRVRPGDRLTILASDEYSLPLVEPLRRAGASIRLPFRERSRDARMHWLDTALGQTARAGDLDRFYALLAELQEGPMGFPALGALAENPTLPARGVYFFFEAGESRLTSPSVARVFRVGTHAVSSGSSSTLWGRLRTHLGTRAGGGNHRSSIMRLHIGNALLARDHDRFSAPTWGSEQISIEAERSLEQAVSEHIASMRVLCIAVPDAASATSDRSYIERHSIALLSGNRGPLDVAHSAWLGSHSPHPAIRRSSLWNVNYVDDSYDSSFLDVLAAYVQASTGKRDLPPASLAPPDWPTRLQDPGQQMLFGAAL